MATTQDPSCGDVPQVPFEVTVTIHLEKFRLGVAWRGGRTHPPPPLSVWVWQAHSPPFIPFHAPSRTARDG